MNPSSDNEPVHRPAGDFSSEAEADAAAAPLDDSVSAAQGPPDRPGVGEAGLASTGAAIGGGQAPQVGADKDDLRDRTAGKGGSDTGGR